jgi:hypothetical protein
MRKLPAAVCVSVLIGLMAVYFFHRDQNIDSRSDYKTREIKDFMENRFQHKEDPLDSRALIPFPSDVKSEFLKVRAAAISVVSGKSQLALNDEFFGEGKEHWPKNPGPPDLSYFSRKLGPTLLSTTFKRDSSGSFWTECTIVLTPANYPAGVYQMDLTEIYFTDEQFDKSYVEDQASTKEPKLNVFDFHMLLSGSRVNITYRSKPEVSNIKDHYPKSFHRVTIRRTAQ